MVLRFNPRALPPECRLSIIRHLDSIRREVESMPVHKSLIFRSLWYIRREVKYLRDILCDNLTEWESSVILWHLDCIRREVENKRVMLCDDLTEWESLIFWHLHSIRGEVEDLPEFESSISGSLGSIWREVENPPGETTEEISDKQLFEIAEMVPEHKMIQVGLNLKTEAADICRYLQMNTIHDGCRGTWALLQAWKENTRVEDQRVQLKRALEKAQLGGIADQHIGQLDHIEGAKERNELTARKSSFSMDLLSIQRELENPPGDLSESKEKSKKENSDKTPQSSSASVLCGEPADNREGWPPFYITKASYASCIWILCLYSMGRMKLDEQRRDSFSTLPLWLMISPFGSNGMKCASQRSE